MQVAAKNLSEAAQRTFSAELAALKFEVQSQQKQHEIQLCREHSCTARQDNTPNATNNHAQTDMQPTLFEDQTQTSLEWILNT